MMSESCARCECALDGDCCGDGRPFELDNIAYCCQSCAEDGECACGCVAAPAAVGVGGEGGAPGPLI